MYCKHVDSNLNVPVKLYFCSDRRSSWMLRNIDCLVTVVSGQSVDYISKVQAFDSLSQNVGS
jgi:hypothetical protein